MIVRTLITAYSQHIINSLLLIIINSQHTNYLISKCTQSNSEGTTLFSNLVVEFWNFGTIHRIVLFIVQ